MKAFWIRLFELVFVNCLLSAVVTAMLSAGNLRHAQWIPFLMLLSANAVFLVVQWARLRVLCFEMQSLGRYFAVALSSFAVFAILQFVCYAVCVAQNNPTLYNWLFVTTELLTVATELFAEYSTGALLSAILFEALLLCTVFLAPFHRRLPEEEDDFSPAVDPRFYQ